MSDMKNQIVITLNSQMGYDESWFKDFDQHLHQWLQDSLRNTDFTFDIKENTK